MRGAGPRHRGNQWKTASEMAIYSIPANKSQITQIGRRSMPRRQVNRAQSVSKAKVCSIPVSKHSTSPIGRRLMLRHMWILYRFRRLVLGTPESEKRLPSGGDAIRPSLPFHIIAGSQDIDCAINQNTRKIFVKKQKNSVDTTKNGVIL